MVRIASVEVDFAVTNTVRKEVNVLFNDALNTFLFIVIWRQMNNGIHISKGWSSILFVMTLKMKSNCQHYWGARCSSVVRAFAHGAMGRRIDPSWGGPIELFLVPASAPRLV